MPSASGFISLSLIFVFMLHPFPTFLHAAEAARRWWPRNVEAESWPMRRQAKASGRCVNIWDEWTDVTQLYKHDNLLKLETNFQLYVFRVPKGLHQVGISKISKPRLKMLPCKVHEILGLSSAKKCVIWISIKTCPSSDPHGNSTKECAEGTIPGREERPSTPGKGDKSCS